MRRITMWRLGCVAAMLAVVVNPSVAQDAPLIEAASAVPSRIPSSLLTKAQAECCPFWFSGDKASFDRCCIRFGFCPICNGISLQSGCWYRRAWYPIGAVIEQNAQKCYRVRCVWAKPQPTVEIQHISRSCGCCLYRGSIYPPGHILHIGVCRWQQCREGRWHNIPSPPGTFRPCPPGTITYNNNYCLFVWPNWVPWQTASKYCSMLGGYLALPFNFKENELVLNQLNGSAGWLSKEIKYDARSWGNGTSPLADSAVLKRGLPSDQCLGIRLGSRRWSVFPCGFHAQPVCLIPRVPCSQTHCNIFGKQYKNGQVIYNTRCERIICLNGYAQRILSRECCYYQGWHPLHGWTSGYYPPGSFSPFPGTRCYCRGDGTVTCCTGPRCLFVAQADEFQLSAGPVVGVLDNVGSSSSVLGAGVLAQNPGSAINVTITPGDAAAVISSVVAARGG